MLEEQPTEAKRQVSIFRMLQNDLSRHEYFLVNLDKARMAAENNTETINITDIIEGQNLDDSLSMSQMEEYDEIEIEELYKKFEEDVLGEKMSN